MQCNKFLSLFPFIHLLFLSRQMIFVRMLRYDTLIVVSFSATKISKYMILGKKSILFILLFIGIMVIGFIFLLRGCLSKFDERSALPGILYFEKEGQGVIFSIVKFEKATSYSQKGGITHKSVSTNYFIQTNDAVTGKKIADKKVRHNSDIKNHPVEVLGGSNNTAWIFMNEIMAFDPFTLEQKTGLSSLEE